MKRTLIAAALVSLLTGCAHLMHGDIQHANKTDRYNDDRAACMKAVGPMFDAEHEQKRPNGAEAVVTTATNAAVIMKGFAPFATSPTMTFADETRLWRQCMHDKGYIEKASR